MKLSKILTAGAVAFSLALSAAPSLAQHHDDHGHDDFHGHGGPPHGYVHHDNWHRGYRMAPNDWGRGRRIDYRAYHLAPPRRGYEWREVDGNYVMAAVATGIIASTIIATSR
ncbi:MAG: RcnB family protein [Acidobacteriaceae bacterium]|nr:RcnB family protein [Acidobacteriaceae bacterium]